MPQVSLRNGNQNILSHHLHGNRSERGSSRTTVGSSTAISTKYGGDPKTISKLIILTKYGGEPDTSEKSTGKTILKIILTQNIRQYNRNSAFCWSKFAGRHKHLLNMCTKFYLKICSFTIAPPQSRSTTQTVENVQVQ